ncbi:hypothetical protein RIF29_15300 [Crotalaria pallida]|uniref:Uncharacterized protein n=1 Tax=Crotalaria pallida TaxID=3830 RepID=A0AAN9FEV7_CROPI
MGKSQVLMLGYRSRSGDGTAARCTLASTPTGSMTGLRSTRAASLLATGAERLTSWLLLGFLSSSSCHFSLFSAPFFSSSAADRRRRPERQRPTPTATPLTSESRPLLFFLTSQQPSAALKH